MRTVCSVWCLFTRGRSACGGARNGDVLRLLLLLRHAEVLLLDMVIVLIDIVMKQEEPKSRGRLVQGRISPKEGAPSELSRVCSLS